MTFISDTPNSLALEADALTLVRGDHCLFSELSFALQAGQLVSLEGPNGSGKTSLIRTLAGLLAPESGEVRWNGNAIRKQRQEYAAAFVYLGHKPGLKRDLNIVQNLRFEERLRPRGPIDLEHALERVGVRALRRLAVGRLSAGQQRRVALARLLLADAPLWLMDEPFTNLDRAGQDLVNALVDEHLQSGGLCVISAHQALSLDSAVQRVDLS